VYKIAVRGMAESVTRALERASLDADDIDLVVPHQANLRIIQAATSRLGVPESKVMVNIAHHGNTSAASIPMALCDALDEGRVSPNDTIAITAFGGGVTWGSVIFRWGERVSRCETSDAALPEPTGDVFDVLAPNREFYSSYHESN